MDISALDQAIGKTPSGRGRELSLAAIARATFMTEMKEAADRPLGDAPRSDAKRSASSQMKHLAFRSDPLPAPRWEPEGHKTRSAFSGDGSEDPVRTETDSAEPLNARSSRDNPEEETPDTGSAENAAPETENSVVDRTSNIESVAAPESASSDAGQSAGANVPTLQTPIAEPDNTSPKGQVVADAMGTAGDGMPAVPQTTPLPAAFSDGMISKGGAAAGAGGQSQIPSQAPGVPPQNPLSQTGAQTPGQTPALPDAVSTPVKSAEVAQAAQAAAAQTKDGSIAKPSIQTDTSIKISIDSAQLTTGQVKALPSTGGTLFQAQQAAATGMAQPGLTLPALGQGAGGMPASQGASNANGGQPLFVGADGGAHAQNAGANGGQTGGQQTPQGGGQGTAGQAGFQFGQSANGKGGFGNDATRAQFQDIMMTRTARPSALGNAPGGLQAANGGPSTASLASSSPVTAGPGGPQSTFSATMASTVAQATSGRPGATPGAAVDQVAVKLTSSAKDGGGKISIRLNPEELGKVDVKLEIGRDGTVRATVSADRPETLDLMQRDARALEKALQDAGLKTDSNSLQFEKHEGQNASGRQHADNETGGSGASGKADSPDELQDTEIDTAPGDGIADDGSLNLVA